MVEFHPVLVSLSLVPGREETGALALRNDYLEGRGAAQRDATFTYTDGPALTEATTSYEWAHGLGEVVSALVRAGLPIRSLRESDELPWPRWPEMQPTGAGFFRLPDSAPRIPLFYALKAGL